jgi:hypothetical protein
MDPINKFQGRYRWLSNFWSCFVTLDGVEYPSVENAYMAAKTLDFEERKQFEGVFPGEAKRLGRELELRDGWDAMKLDVMEKLLRQKFAHGTELAQRLIATHPAILIEGNDWGDEFWGVNNKTGVGENHLGKLLMKIRGMDSRCTGKVRDQDELVECYQKPVFKHDRCKRCFDSEIRYLRKDIAEKEHGLPELKARLALLES